MTDTELMQSIKTRYHGREILYATRPTQDSPALDPAFLAALIANESGGDPNAKRFEKNVLAALWEVLLGRKAAYGSITHTTLFAYLWTDNYPAQPVDEFKDSLQRLDGLATSWGLTQIMGYHVLETGLVPVPAVDPQSMAAVAMSLHYTVAMLKQFAAEFKFDVTNSFSAMFHCWNTGHPTGQTFDPNYTANGLRRMDIYKALP